MDYDSFSLEGGTNWYTQAQTVVTNAQPSLPARRLGAADGKQSRYALIDNILSQTFHPLRRCYYEYHQSVWARPSTTRRGPAGDVDAITLPVHRIRPATTTCRPSSRPRRTRSWCSA